MITINIVIGVLFFVAAVFLLFAAAGEFTDWKKSVSNTAVAIGFITLVIISITTCSGGGSP